MRRAISQNIWSRWIWVGVIAFTLGLIGFGCSEKKAPTGEDSLLPDSSWAIEKIFVQSGNNGVGTASDPLGSLSEAISKSISTKISIIYLASGTYKIDQPITSSISIFGSRKPVDNWSEADTVSTRFISSEYDSVLLRIDSVDSLKLRLVNLEGPRVDIASGSSFAVVVRNSSVVFERCVFSGGKGGSGFSGDSGASGEFRYQTLPWSSLHSPNGGGGGTNASRDINCATVRGSPGARGGSAPGTDNGGAGGYNGPGHEGLPGPQGVFGRNAIRLFPKSGPFGLVIPNIDSGHTGRDGSCGGGGGGEAVLTPMHRIPNVALLAVTVHAGAITHPVMVGTGESAVAEEGLECRVVLHTYFAYLGQLSQLIVVFSGEVQPDRVVTEA